MDNKVCRIIVVLLLMFFSSCSKQDKKAMYFEGSVGVQYLPWSQTGTREYLTIRFQKNGEYGIFFLTSNGDKKGNNFPKDIVLKINNAPEDCIISSDIFPENMIIEIQINHGKTERHVF